MRLSRAGVVEQCVGSNNDNAGGSRLLVYLSVCRLAYTPVRLEFAPGLIAVGRGGWSQEVGMGEMYGAV